MNEHDIAEQAYKNGYEKGYEDGKRDAVEVVRCKDCAWWNENDSIFCTANKECRCGYWKGLFDYCKPNDFCSYGERREGE